MDIRARVKQHDAITFVRAETIQKDISGNCGWATRHHLKVLTKRLLKQGITLLQLSYEDREAVRNDSDLTFDDSDMLSLNTLYFRLDNNNSCGVIKYYTTDKLETKREAYASNLFYLLMQEFGLKTATLRYSESSDAAKETSVAAGVSGNANGVELANVSGGGEHKVQDTRSMTVASVREFESTSCEWFFRCYGRRAFWCDKHYGKVCDVDDAVASILEHDKEYSFKSYTYNGQLKQFLRSRLSGSKHITYEIKSDSSHVEKHRVFAKTAASFPGFGFSTNVDVTKTNSNSNSVTRVISAEFYSVCEMEMLTLANILERDTRLVDTDSLASLKNEFYRLNDVYADEVRNEISQIEEAGPCDSLGDTEKRSTCIQKLEKKLAQQQKRCQRVEARVDDRAEDGEVVRMREETARMESKVEKQKLLYQCIMKQRSLAEEHKQYLVPHLGTYDNKYQRWSCCPATTRQSSCTRVKPMDAGGFDRRARAPFDAGLAQTYDTDSSLVPLRLPTMSSAAASVVSAVMSEVAGSVDSASRAASASPEASTPGVLSSAAPPSPLRKAPVGEATKPSSTQPPGPPPPSLKTKRDALRDEKMKVMRRKGKSGK